MYFFLYFFLPGTRKGWIEDKKKGSTKINIPICKMENTVIETVTSRMQSGHSTTELIPRLRI